MECRFCGYKMKKNNKGYLCEYCGYKTYNDVYYDPMEQFRSRAREIEIGLDFPPGLKRKKK